MNKDNLAQTFRDHVKTELWPPVERGGQHTSGPDRRGVRVTHIPTGLDAYCVAARSQHRNREIALAMLEYGLAELGQ